MISGPTPSAGGVRGALTAFSSRAQDPNWDRRRKLRAQPYQARMDAWRRGMKAWKRSGPFGLGGWSWNKPIRPPGAPAELAPYVKAVGRGALAKGLPLPLRAARAVLAPVVARGASAVMGAAGRHKGKLAAAGLAAGTYAAGAHMWREGRKRRDKKRVEMFGARAMTGLGKLSKRGDQSDERDNRLTRAVGLGELRKGFFSAIGGIFRRKPAPYGGAWNSKSLLAAHDRERAKFRGMAAAFQRGRDGARPANPAMDQMDRKFSAARDAMRQRRAVVDARLAKFFDESKVRRADDGKFAPKGGGSSKMAAGAPRPRHVASIYARGPNWEDREEKAPYDWARSVRPTKDMPHGLRQAYAKYRAELDAKPPAPPAREARKEIAVPDLSNVESTGRFIEGSLVQRIQIPKAVGEAKGVEFARWAADRTKELRDEVTLKSIGRRDPGGHKNRIMIPIGTDPKDKDLRFAANLARNLALMDNGIQAYDYRMTPETLKALSPYKDFIKHARRSMANRIREEAPAGMLAHYRREFGTPFKDGRTYQADTRGGHKKGEEKKAFPRMMHFLKAVDGGPLAKSRQLTEAERKQRIDAARASAAARSKARQQPTARSFDRPGPGYSPIPEKRLPSRAAAERVIGWDEGLRQRRAELQGARTLHEGVFVGQKPSAKAAKEIAGIEANLRTLRPTANKARSVLRLRDLRGEQGPRWRYVGLAPEHWEPVENLRAAPVFRDRPRVKAQPPTATATGSAPRAAMRWGRGAKIGAGVAGAAAVAGLAYGAHRWRQSRKAA